MVKNTETNGANEMRTIEVQVTYQRPGYSVNIKADGRSVAHRYGIATRRQAVAIAAELANDARRS
jgi:hypothetical protein